MLPHLYFGDSNASLRELIREFKVMQVNKAQAARSLAMHSQCCVRAIGAISTDTPVTPPRSGTEFRGEAKVRRRAGVEPNQLPSSPPEGLDPARKNSTRCTLDLCSQHRLAHFSFVINARSRLPVAVGTLTGERKCGEAGDRGGLDPPWILGNSWSVYSSLRTLPAAEAAGGSGATAGVVAPGISWQDGTRCLS